MSGAIAFLGSTAFRWLFGEVLDFFKRRQEASNEIALRKLEHEIARDTHQWQQEAIKAQAEAGIRVIEAKAQATAQEAADKAFLAAVEGVGLAAQRPDWIGAWNAMIRPLLATIAIACLVAESFGVLTLSLLLADICAAVLGVFVGERIHVKRK